MARHNLFKRNKVLEEEVRGLRKRIKAISRASENNFRGMIHWKTKALNLEGGLKVINAWLEPHIGKKK